MIINIIIILTIIVLFNTFSIESNIVINLNTVNYIINSDILQS